jgi:hypothetical protein
MPELREWESFYVIVGAAAGALIGLQFVVMTLIAERPPERVEEATAAFASPTIVHFSTVLLVAALLRIPSHAITTLAVLWGAVGVAGVVYVFVVARRARTQQAYKPDLEDWAFHIGLPFLAYAALIVTAVLAIAHVGEALLGVGAVVLLLLFTAIHNAWDAVAYTALVVRRRDKLER